MATYTVLCQVKYSASLLAGYVFDRDNEGSIFYEWNQRQTVDVIASSVEEAIQLAAELVEDESNNGTKFLYAISVEKF